MSALARVGRLVRVEAQKVLGGRGLLVGVVAVAAVTALTGWAHASDSAYETAWPRTAFAAATAAPRSASRSPFL